MSDLDCPICLQKIQTHVLLPCNHSICLNCYGAMTYIYSEHFCPICQKDYSDFPIISQSKLKNSYSVEILRFQKDAKRGVYYDTQETLDSIAELKMYHCQKCGKDFEKLRIFSNHIHKEHNSELCKICKKSNRFLPSKLQIYSRGELKKHMKIHPKCTLCEFIGFDDHELSEHMLDNHYRCDICAQNNVIVWFKDAELYQVHLHEKHYACEDPVCVSQGFIAFATPMELQLHRMNVHGDKSPATIDFMSINQVKEEKKQIQIEKMDKQKRHKEALQKLKNSLKRQIKNQEVEDRILNALSDLNQGKIEPKEFLDIYNKESGKFSDNLFCDVMACILIP